MMMPQIKEHEATAVHDAAEAAAKLKGVQERSHRLTAERKTLEAAQATLDTELVEVQLFSRPAMSSPSQIDCTSP